MTRKPNYDDRLADYNDVPSRIADFRNKHPEGCLQPANPERPYTIEAIGERVFIVYTAAAFRSPEDPRPGIGCAWEPFPGLTPYTKNSELQNAETSAWGRAIVAALAADSRAIATSEDVQNRRAEQEHLGGIKAALHDRLTALSGDARASVAERWKELNAQGAGIRSLRDSQFSEADADAWDEILAFATTEPSETSEQLVVS